MEITCSPKALGSGRWAALEIFSFPTLDVIEKYVMECVLKAGSQHCPPVVIGVGIGGSFDHCAKLAKTATLRPFGQKNPEPILAAMEERLLKAVNKTGFGPMGTGGDTTALAVHVEYALRARLHAGRGVLQLLDQPARQRAHLQQRRDRPFRIEARPDGRHRQAHSAADRGEGPHADGRRFRDARRRDRHHRRPADAPSHHRAHRRRHGRCRSTSRAERSSTSAATAATATARSRCST